MLSHLSQIKMADLLVLRRLRRRNRIQRILIDRENPFEFSERKFINTFRLSKYAAQYVIDKIRPIVTLGKDPKGYPLELYVSKKSIFYFVNSEVRSVIL